MASENNKRIAKNTLMLYFRMMLTMGVSLYTSRVVLNTLGVTDFGIYNVVGGVVAMFAFLNGAMASGTQRFLSFELGKGNLEELKKVFGMSINIHTIIAVIVLLLAETIGLWFLNAKLIIPEERIDAANWVYQFSVLSFIVSILSVPYNAIIIAHERMNVYAIVSIVEVLMKLVAVFTLVWFGFDKLKLYALLIFVISFILWIIYKTYCKKNYKETNYRFFWDKQLFKVLMSYTGWNLFGNVAGVLMGQGINILLNLFFGPVVNAARGIAYQVNAAVSGFVTNFQMAMNPQIVKTFAANDKQAMHQLIFQGSKYSFFLLFLISLPILLETEFIIRLWLKIVPEYVVVFCQLILINALIDCLSGSLMAAAQASGKIKLYQSAVGTLLILILPISFFLLKMGFQPQVTFYVNICISVIALFVRLLIIAPLINLSILAFIKKVLLRVIIVAFAAIVLPLFVKLVIGENLFNFLIVSFLSILSVLISIYFIGLIKEEKKIIHSQLIQFTYKFRM